MAIRDETCFDGYKKLMVGALVGDQDSRYADRVFQLLERVEYRRAESEEESERCMACATPRINARAQFAWIPRACFTTHSTTARTHGLLGYTSMATSQARCGCIFPPA